MAKRKPRKKGQHRNSPNHSDLFTDENPKGTIKGLKFATVKDAKTSVNKIKRSGKKHNHKTQAAIAMEQRAESMGKKSAAAVFRKFINQQKKKTKEKNESVVRSYVRYLLREDAIGFVHDLAAASDEFGEEGVPFFGGNPGKGGGRAIKRAFNANADHNWLATLDTVHWTSDLEMLPQLATKSKDELSTIMVLPSEDFPPESGEYGLWIKGRITLAANDMDQLYSGRQKDYGPGKEGTEEEVTHRDKSSGRNKRPTVAKDYSRYGSLQRGTEFGEKMAKNIPYVLDQSMWNPDDWKGNEALVDNWKPIGLVLTYDDQAYTIQGLDDLKTKEDIEEYTLGITKQIMLAALKIGVPIYNLQKDELWSPK